jgi:tetratricopeptide (TPR) repeat protein
MPLSTTLVGLLLAVFNSLAASTIKGVILEMGGSPIANVQVSALEGANPTSSLANGTFVLDFRDKQPGDTVQLIVQKPGMIVVNEFQLQLTLPKAASATPLILFLCKEAEREEMTLRFHRLNPFDRIEKRFRTKLEDLEAENKATEAAKEQFRIERDHAREEAQFAAEQLARARLGEVSDLYRQAMSTVYLSGIATTLNDLGIMYHHENRMEEARKVFDEALTIRRELAQQDSATYSPDVVAKALNNVAETLNNLGNMLSDQNRMQEAVKAYDEALTIRRKLAQRNPIYLLAVVTTLNDFGVSLLKQNRIEEARKAHEEAQESRRQLERLIVASRKAFEPRPLGSAQQP